MVLPIVTPRETAERRRNGRKMGKNGWKEGNEGKEGRKKGNKDMNVEAKEGRIA